MEEVGALILASICLILENNYPFLTGGVSNWVQMLISGLPEFNFSIANLYTGSEPKVPNYNVAGSLVYAFISFKYMKKFFNELDFYDCSAY